MSSLSRVLGAAVVGALVSCLAVQIPAVPSVVPHVPSAAAETIDGSFDGVGRLSAGETFDLVVVGRGGVPATGVDSVALNVTVTGRRHGVRRRCGRRAALARWRRT